MGLLIHPTSQHHLRVDRGAVRAAASHNAKKESLYPVGVTFDVAYAAEHPKQRLDVYFPVDQSQLLCLACTSVGAGAQDPRAFLARESWGSWGCVPSCLARTPLCSKCRGPMMVSPLRPEAGRCLLPTVLVVHGGGWKRFGRRGLCGLHGNVGRSLASRGYVAVVASYRTSIFRVREAVFYYFALSLLCGVIASVILAGQASELLQARDCH